MTGKTILITGASSGIGSALAKAALDQGWRVAATVRSDEAVRQFESIAKGNGIARLLDVTDSARVNDVISEIEETLSGIDVVVNNAGYGYIAAIEEGEDQDIRHLFETNVFGLLSVTRQVLAGMRRRRRGHIINISSIGGMLALPGSGYYHATKFAVEGLSESLSLETAPLGIRVTVVEPGRFRTDFAGRSIKMSETTLDDYAGTAGVRRSAMSEIAKTAVGDPRKAARAILSIAGIDAPPLRLLLGSDAYNLAIGRLDSLRTSFEEWKPVSIDTDFDC